jgi:hypothetical protein
MAPRIPALEWHFQSRNDQLLALHYLLVSGLTGSAMSHRISIFLEVEPAVFLGLLAMSGFSLLWCHGPPVV